MSHFGNGTARGFLGRIAAELLLVIFLIGVSAGSSRAEQEFKPDQATTSTMKQAIAASTDIPSLQQAIAEQWTPDPNAPVQGA